MAQFIILPVKLGSKEFTEKALNVHQINVNRCNNTISKKLPNKYVMSVAASTATKSCTRQQICYKLLQKLALQK